MTESVELPPISGECVVTEREPLSPMFGKPNPELERVSAPQKVFIFLFVVGFIVLLALLAYLPSVATPFK